jgi:hypothetical protein
MKKRSSDPIPVVDLPREHELAKLAVLVESAMQEPPAGLPQVKWRIRSTVRRHTKWRRRVLRVSLVGALLFVAGGVVGAMVQPVFYSRLRSAAPPPADSPASSSRPRRVHKRLQPQQPADEAQQAVPEAATVSSTTPAATEATGPTAATSPLPEARSGAMATTTTQPAVRLASAASARVRLPPAPLPKANQPSEGVRHAASAATWVASPAGPPAELPLQPLRPDPRRIALVTPPAPPAPSLRTPDPPPQAATPDVAPSAPVPLAAPPLHKPADVAMAAPAPAADEQVLLGKALQKLRIARDPVGALALLDQHAARFPSGTLAPEAARLRTEALMLTGRKDVVLADLDRRADTLAGSDERRLLRGELRATAGRWHPALADFDAVLHSLSQGIAATDVKTREWFERALWGRASARSQLADQAGARSDLLDYLRRFPNGRFAAEARRLVNERR